MTINAQLDSLRLGAGRSISYERGGMRKSIRVIDADFSSALMLTAGLWLFAFGFQGLIELGLNGMPALAGLTRWTPIVAVQVALALLLYPVIVATEGLSRTARVGILVIAVLVIGLGETSVQIIERVLTRRNALSDFAKQATWRVGIAPQMLFYIYIVGFNALLIVFSRAAIRAAEQARQLVRAEAAAQSARLAALRYQINPHFLFNTLNAISSLIVTKRAAQADEMVIRLSSYLRSSLESDARDVVRLDDELAAVQAYLDIEAVRFGDRMTVDYALPRVLTGAAVPSLILQPLVENAVKYGAGLAEGEVAIRIEASQDMGFLSVSIENTQGANSSEPQPAGTGVGLTNVRQRLQVIYGDEGRLLAVPVPGGWRATVSFPLSLLTN